MTKVDTIRSVRLIDTTLRDGAQAPGVRFGLRDRIEIAQALCVAGIDELEVGTPAMGPVEERAIAQIVRLGLTCRLSAWCRARIEDISAAARCGVEAVHLSLPVSNIHLDAMGKSRQWAIEQLNTFVPIARNLFQKVTVGAQDATRTEPSWLSDFARIARNLGACRLRIADTVGVGRPSTLANLIGLIRNENPNLPLEFHGHNDLGLSVANALTAVEGGCEALSVTVNGLGERAGNVALEQIATILDLHPSLQSRIDCRNLLALCRTVAVAASRPIPPDRPIVGEMSFSHESGIHCHAMLRDARTYEPFDPQNIGRAQRRFIMGSHSGRAALRFLLARAGIDASPPQIDALRDLLRN